MSVQYLLQYYEHDTNTVTLIGKDILNRNTIFEEDFLNVVYKRLHPRLHFYIRLSDESVIK